MSQLTVLVSGCQSLCLYPSGSSQSAAPELLGCILNLNAVNVSAALKVININFTKEILNLFIFTGKA